MRSVQAGVLRFSTPLSGLAPDTCKPAALDISHQRKQWGSSLLQEGRLPGDCDWNSYLKGLWMKPKVRSGLACRPLLLPCLQYMKVKNLQYIKVKNSHAVDIFRSSVG